MQPASPKIASHSYSLPKKLKILATLLVFLFIYSTAGHMIIFGAPFLDSFFQTINTLALHYELSPTALGEAFQKSVVLFGVIVFWWVIWTLLDLTVEGKFKEYFSEVKVMSDINNMKNHYIICGAGRVGSHIAKLLSIEKKPFVMIDSCEEDVENAKRKGFIALHGDPFEENTLMKCGLAKARALIAVMSETEKNILATLIAKQFNPNIHVYSRTEKEELISTLKKVGADHVIMPEAAGAVDIVKAIQRDDREYEEILGIKEKVGRK